MSLQFHCTFSAHDLEYLIWILTWLVVEICNCMQLQGFPIDSIHLCELDECISILRLTHTNESQGGEPYSYAQYVKTDIFYYNSQINPYHVLCTNQVCHTWWNNYHPYIAIPTKVLVCYLWYCYLCRTLVMHLLCPTSPNLAIVGQGGDWTN